MKGGRVVIWVNDRWGLEIMPPGKAYNLLTDHLIIGPLRRSEFALEKWFSQTIHKLFSWMVILYKHLLDAS